MKATKENSPVVRNIYVTNITSEKSKYALFLQGYKRSPISNLIIDDCTLNNVQEGNVLNHYKNLTMRNVYINGELQQN